MDKIMNWFQGMKIAGFKIESPLFFASGCLEIEGGGSDLLPFQKAGAVVLKTVTLNPLSGNPMPRTAETAFGLLNSIGLQNKGLEYYVATVLPALESRISSPLIGSIGGFTVDEYVRVAKRLDREKLLSAIEVNISCPNMEGNGFSVMFAQKAELTYKVVKAVREATYKPLIAKLSPAVSDIAEIAKTAVSAGADALTVANSYPALAVDVRMRRPKLGAGSGGLSGPAIRPLNLKKTREVFRAVDVPIIASGGICSVNDALEYIIAGAVFFSLGTVNFINPNAGSEILDGIAEYLTKNGISYKELFGSLKD